MKTDARVRYTKRMIREVFIGLLEQKPIDRITVTEICEKAEINRATFYKYYQDVYDLFDRIEDDIYEQFVQELGNLEKDGLHDTLVRILTGFRDHFSEYLAVLGKNTRGGYLNEKISRRNYELFAPKIPFGEAGIRNEAEKKMLYSYVSAGSGGILEYWCRGGMKETPDEIADMMELLIDATMRGVREESAGRAR